MPENESQDEIIAARLRINQMIELRVAVQALEGRRLLHIREYVLNDDNELVPTAKGVALPVEKLPEVLEAVSLLRTADSNDDVCAIVALARGKEVRFSLATWKGTTKADIRVYYENAEHVKLPTKKGSRFNVRLLPELERALEVLDRQLATQ